MPFSESGLQELQKVFHENKVEISCAITEIFPFLHRLRDKHIISQRKFQMYRREQKPVDQLIYSVLESIEKKVNITILKELFSNSNLSCYPNLNPVHRKFEHVLSGKRRHSVPEKRSVTRPGSSEDPERKKARRDVSLDSKTAVLPVSCGEARGDLHLEKLAKGVRQKCIAVWFTVTEFEAHGKHGRNKSWRRSICHNGRPLQELIEKRIIPNPPMKSSKKSETQARTPHLSQGNGTGSSREQFHFPSEVMSAGSEERGQTLTSDRSRKQPKQSVLGQDQVLQRTKVVRPITGIAKDHQPQCQGGKPGLSTLHHLAASGGIQNFPTTSLRKSQNQCFSYPLQTQEGAGSNHSPSCRTQGQGSGPSAPHSPKPQGEASSHCSRGDQKPSAPHQSQSLGESRDTWRSPAQFSERRGNISSSSHVTTRGSQHISSHRESRDHRTVHCTQRSSSEHQRNPPSSGSQHDQFFFRSMDSKRSKETSPSYLLSNGRDRKAMFR